MARVFVITGPSGVGKGTLIRGLLQRVPELELSVSATTRTPRPGERHGRHYHFMDAEEFDRRAEAGEFVEHATYSGRRYGTLRAELEGRRRDGVPVVLEIELQGARQVREAMPEALAVFIAPPSNDALRARLVGRGTDAPEQIEARSSMTGLNRLPGSWSESSAGLSRRPRGRPLALQDPTKEANRDLSPYRQAARARRL